MECSKGAVGSVLVAAVGSAAIWVGVSACDGSLQPLAVGQPLGYSDGGPGDAGHTSDAGPALRPGGCRSTADCAGGKVCSRARPGCVEPACGLPQTTGGLWGGAGSCYAGRICEPGYICVSSVFETVEALTETPTLTTVPACMPACDACADECPAGMTCIQLPDQPGGFCNSGPLAAERQPCGRFMQHCMAGMACEAGGCVRRCEPDAGQELKEPGDAANSEDCAVDELCVAEQDPAPTNPAIGLYQVCRVARFVRAGESCDGSRRCRAPYECRVSICSPEDCGAGCPAGTECFAGTVCIRDGGVAYAGPCYEDRNCAADLACIGEQGSGRGRCLVPPPETSL